MKAAKIWVIIFATILFLLGIFFTYKALTTDNEPIAWLFVVVFFGASGGLFYLIRKMG